MTELFANHPDLWLSALPVIGTDAHKYDRGYCNIFAAPSLTGATRMAAEAALRIGAGLVTVQAKARGDVYRTSLPPEIMVQDDGEPVPEKASVLLGGPGGIHPDHKQLLLSFAGMPRVIDSAALPDRPEAINGTDRTVLTPHQGEFDALFGPVQGSRKGAAKAAAERANSIIVLKGPKTLITHPDGRLIINDRPNPNLATAGTGDVLAGMIAGLLARGTDAFHAAAAAVWMHSEAATRIGRGLVASDIIGEIPTLLRWLDKPE